jgi:hypothetical protein
MLHETKAANLPLGLGHPAWDPEPRRATGLCLRSRSGKWQKRDRVGNVKQERADGQVKAEDGLESLTEVKMGVVPSTGQGLLCWGWSAKWGPKGPGFHPTPSSSRWKPKVQSVQRNLQISLNLHSEVGDARW